MEENYQLLDCGGQAKLERFGPVVLSRPSPQSLWNRHSPERWKKADATYHRSTDGGGDWTRRNDFAQPWTVAMGGMKLRLQTTGFGHVGVFPEQIPFWHWVREQCERAERPLRVLNLFAYTGGASIAAAQGGAEVTHCDSSKGIVQWASENARANGFPPGDEGRKEESLVASPENPRLDDSLLRGGIRWIVDDATAFAAREVRRHRRYDALILDPPSFGRGPKGQVFKLERDLPAFLLQLSELLSIDPAFVLLSAHTPGVPEDTGKIKTRSFKTPESHGCGEMTIPEASGDRVLPSGSWAAWCGGGGLPQPFLPPSTGYATGDASGEDRRHEDREGHS